jgi:SnoaL-like domain
MSQENVELVRRGFAAFEQDLGGMLDLMTEDLVTYRSEPDNATYHGKEGFLEAATDGSQGFSEWAVVAERFVEAGDNVVAQVRQCARSQTSAPASFGPAPCRRKRRTPSASTAAPHPGGRRGCRPRGMDGYSGHEPGGDERLFERHRDAEAARDYEVILATFVEDCFIETHALGLRSQGRAQVRKTYEEGYFGRLPGPEPDDTDRARPARPGQCS